MKTQGFLHTPFLCSPPARDHEPETTDLFIVAQVGNLRYTSGGLRNTRGTIRGPGLAARAFTLAEVLVAIFMGAVFLTALYGAFTFGFASVKASREDLRATQILTEQMEQLRLQPFSSLQSFTTNIYFDPTDQINGGGGAYYTLTVTTNAPAVSDLVPPGMFQYVYYTDLMRKVTATATWTNGTLLQTRSLQSYVSLHGVQPYVFSPK